MRKTMRWCHHGLVAGVCLLMGAATGGAQEAAQPEAAETQAAETQEQQEDVIGLGTFQVVGSRLPGRSAQDSPVPVDVIRGEDLQTYGIRDMDSLLSATVPSYNVNQQPISDAATLIRPANLRGLSSDQTLVLVNGKRRHRASVITWLGGGVSDGSHAPDISVIPAIALDRVEVLRDGAAAQYGSDAIAGILNFKLREDREGLEVHTSYGQTYHGDGDKVQVAANLGLPLTENGFANLSFEFMNADETSRSVQRDDARGLIEAGNEHVRRPAAQIWGAPEVQYDYKFFGNLGLDLEDINARLYAFGNYAERKVEGGFFFRNPNTRGGVFDGPYRLTSDDSEYKRPKGLTDAQNDARIEAGLADGSLYDTLKVADLSGTGAGGCIVRRDTAADYTGALAGLPEHCFAFNEKFPGGFTPRFGGYVKDWSIAFGLRGEIESESLLLNGWRYDASASFGENSVDFFMHNTINPQLAAMRTNIPTSYKPGSYTEFDKVFNLDFSRPFDVGLFYSPLNVAFGLEYREEEFEVEAGGENSWYVDDSPNGLAAQGFGIASNGFPGFRPDIAGTFNRGSYAGYIDLEAEMIENLTLGIAGRHEAYEGMADTVDGKASARWQFLEQWAMRGSVSSGFRAPTVGQANVRNVSTTFDEGRLADRATLPPDHPISVLKGGKPLDPEKSINYSVGTVLNLGDLEVTVDYYRIKVQDRIGQTSTQTLTQADIASLVAQGVTDASSYTGVRFFANAFDTTTQGVDIVATYPLESVAGHTLFTFVGNWNDTKVDSFDEDVISVGRLREIQEALPEFRFSLMADHTWGPWRFLTRLHFYDEFYETHLGSESGGIPNYPIEAGERWLVDAELSYTLTNLPLMESATFAFGAENVFDQYPRRNPHARIGGAKYPESSPFGFNGGFYYLRAGFEF